MAGCIDHAPWLKYESRNQAEIIAMLGKQENVRFQTFDMVSEGNYAPYDAAWNYMDIPHLTYVHNQVEGYNTLAADALTSSIFFQKVPLARFPLTVLIYQTSKNSVTYYTSFFLFLLIIETHWEEIAPLRTRVTTRYAIGSSSWLVRLAFPLIKRLLTRNYHILMRDDLPMRDQRGELRKRGYEFRGNNRSAVPSFLASMKIMQQNVLPPEQTGEAPEQNVVAPATVESWGTATVRFDALREGERQLVGPDNHTGLQVVKSSGCVLVYPRLCPHEGASLDRAAPNESCTVMCPWHGRKFKPILTIELPAAPRARETPWHHYAISREALTVTCKPADNSLREADWSRQAA